ncbi:MAG: hypothetical protein HQK59_18395 [Deltaproteobacteria bacterium]|nr:hypothetical protein [Deltaproteobacteria bacterium]
MPAKYHIHTQETPPRFKALIRSGVIAWEEGCLKCAVCVKKQCVYKVYDQRNLDGRQMLDSIDTLCKDCYRCVQGCPARLINKAVNPEYLQIGDEIFTPEIITKTWNQAATGKIPVSGAGYGGKFSGKGFDAMWTDMSEIVRPTRDGIHGREYISTGVDLGRKDMYLKAGKNGEMKLPTYPSVRIEHPVLLQVPSFGAIRKPFLLGLAAAAHNLLTQAIIPAAAIDRDFRPHLAHVVPSLEPNIGLDEKMLSKVSMVEIVDHPKVMHQVGKIKKKSSKVTVIVKVPLNKKSPARCLELVQTGAEVIHLAGNDDGRENTPKNARYIKDAIADVHQKLVENNVRDMVSLITSGGIALAEHVAKGIICGSDAIVADLALLVAVECRVCRGCKQGLPCPVCIEDVTADWTTHRMVNLLGAWHNQLLEISGAMGIRDIRRMRGERGRAMFFEELEKMVFAGLGKPAAK